MMGYTSSQNLPSILEQMFGLRLKEDKSKIQACLTGFERRRRKQAFAEKMKGLFEDFKKKKEMRRRHRPKPKLGKMCS